MLRSLMKYDPRAAIVILALDDACADILEQVPAGSVRVVRLEALHNFIPALKSLNDGRSQWAIYATHKPAMARFVLESAANPDTVTFIDADTWFFSSPEPMYAELAGASIGLSPHRLTPLTRQMSKYGEFNAGCIYWRADGIGRQCIVDWEQDCLNWCDEPVQDDGRFMNQGYLARWLARYANVHVIRHPGVNLAAWNLEAHQLAMRGDTLMIDDVPLIFYHYSGLSREENNQWYTFHPHSEQQIEAARCLIYMPCLPAVEAEGRRLLETYGIDGIGSVRSFPLPPTAVRLYPSHNRKATGK